MVDVNKTHARITARRIVLLASALLAVMLLGSCSNPVTPGIVGTGHYFHIIATSAYSGELTTDSGNTPVSGSADQNITFTPVAGQQYTLTLHKSSADGTTLTAEIIANETIDGTATSVVVQSSSTADTVAPARVVITG